MKPPLSKSASFTASSLSVFILADAIARVFTGLDSITLKDLSSDRYLYMLYQTDDDSITT